MFVLLCMDGKHVDCYANKAMRMDPQLQYPLLGMGPNTKREREAGMQQIQKMK